MKMVKSLLLGSAAGVVAMAGAQAADLPVKAKPVQYVKICSLYGAGFYYIPGTDMCVKVGGWVRLYTIYGANSNSTNGALASGIQNTRQSNDFSYKTRGYVTIDARNQTEYGTVRSYIDVGFSGDSPGNQAFNSNRAFIQFAGFTFGLSQSFYDFYSQPAVSHWGGHITPASDTGDAGQYVWGYTAQFGNGLSASLAAEGPFANRRAVLWGTGAISGPTAAALFGTSNGAYDGLQWPDVVANLRVDQKWGAAQIMGAVHDASGTYYGSTQNTGHPSQATGWAVGAGLKLFAPMIGAGDYFQTQVNYSVGATGYVAAGNVSYSQYKGGSSYGYGLQVDGVYGSTGDIELTTAWGVDASYEHFWNKQWRTSVYGSYVKFDFNDRANALACAASNGIVSTASSSTLCNNDYSYWDIGSRTQWNLSPDTYLSVDIVYTKLNTASKGLVGTVGASGAQPSGLRTIDDQDAWFGQFRVHKDFYP